MKKIIIGLTLLLAACDVYIESEEEWLLIDACREAGFNVKVNAAETVRCI